MNLKDQQNYTLHFPRTNIAIFFCFIYIFFPRGDLEEDFDKGFVSRKNTTIIEEFHENFILDQFSDLSSIDVGF